MNKPIDIFGLIPDFSSILPFPGFESLSAEYLSLVFIVVMLIISTLFLLAVFWHFAKASKRVRRLTSIINGRQELSIANEKGGSVDHLWNEFQQTLIEIRSVDVNQNQSISLYNTIDSSQFFNTSTLASELTENRLLAAVPGFLTGIGVLGTFIGLQLGLSELNIGNDVAVEEMKTGLAQVISGAKIAFLTSVWGVGLSLVFNFIEKGFERRARSKIKYVQNLVDAKYPRLPPERQLQQISDNSAEMRESLQHLGEQIGDRLQAPITDLGNRIVELFEGLAGATGDANQNVLNTLIQEFLNKFGEVGGDQARQMQIANERFANALNSLDSSIASLLKQLDKMQENNVAREESLIQNMSDKVDTLVEKSNEQHKILADFVGKTLSDIGKGETARIESTDSMLKRLENAMDDQLEASAKLIQQGENLQSSLNASVKGNAEMSERLKESAFELNQASQHMKGTGRSIETAGSSLSGSISKAVESTDDLAKENQQVQALLNLHQQTLNEQQQKLNESTDKIRALFDTAQNSFGVMDERQQQFLRGLNDHVNGLTDAIQDNFEGYSKGLNSATTQQLRAFTENTTAYATKMNSAINSLQTVVDEIDSKLPSSK